MNDDIKIYFGEELSNLFELGYISTDIHQLIAFSELIEENNLNQIEKYFGEKPIPINRYVTISKDSKKKSRISEVKQGSIELTLTDIGVVAGIVMPIVAIKVQQYFNERNETVQFQIYAQDQNVQRLLRRYENGDFGRGQEALDRLFRNLEYANYDIQIQNENIYLIEHITNKYSQRIIKTIKKNR